MLHSRVDPDGPGTVFLITNPLHQCSDKESLAAAIAHRAIVGTTTVALTVAVTTAIGLATCLLHV